MPDALDEVLGALRAGTAGLKDQQWVADLMDQRATRIEKLERATELLREAAALLREWSAAAADLT